MSVGSEKSRYCSLLALQRPRPGLRRGGGGGGGGTLVSSLSDDTALIFLFGLAAVGSGVVIS